jgi:ATPase subunit of ABC transporter with duplicated ATPase domains
VGPNRPAPWTRGQLSAPRPRSVTPCEAALSTPHSRPVLSASGLTFRWPDGTPLFDDLDLDVPVGSAGLVGTNGSGKTTLLRLLSGELAPTRGAVAASGRVGVLPQDLALRTDVRVDEHLGIAEVRRALAALEGGDASAAVYDAIGDRWDVEQRAEAELTRVGLPAGILDRPLGALSGGQVVQLGLVRLLLEECPVLVLDEPTNNLDRAARERLYDVFGGWRGTLLVVSHDRDLLERMDRIAELRDGEVRWFGGGYGAYAAQVAVEQDAAAQAVSAARQDVRRRRVERADAERAIAQRRRVGARAARTGGLGRAEIDYQRNRSERTAASTRRVHDVRMVDARARLDEAAARLREDDEIRVDLPGTAVPGRREVLRADAVLAPGSPSLSAWPARSGWRWSERTGAARRPCCTRSPAWCSRARAPSGSGCRCDSSPSASTCSIRG